MILADIITSSVHQIRTGDIPLYAVEGFEGYDFAELGVTEQFLDDAGRYFNRYTQPAHFKELYKIAASRAEIRAASGSLKVLDIGTGGGNSLFAIKEIFDDIQAVGVDISRPLLEMCADTAASNYNMQSSDLALLCADLYDLEVREGSVDLVAGSSILHHMIEPGPIVELSLRALRPGGFAIFTEPFENGHGILRAAYATILELGLDQSNGRIAPDLSKYLNDYIADFDARKGIGEIRDYTKYLDDKWFFTRSWFADIAEKFSCRRLTVTPSHGGEKIFWRQFVAAARLHNGADADAAPNWVKALFERIDDSFSSRQISETYFTGIVVVEK